MQLLELDIPMVLALNMMDEVRRTAVLSVSTNWRKNWEFRLSRSQRQRMKESES